MKFKALTFCAVATLVFGVSENLLADPPDNPDEDSAQPAEESEKADTSAEEVVITGTKTKKLLKETPVKTEVITRKDLERTGATNLAEALENKTGVKVDNQCSVCNAVAIKLSGLPGRYTLLLIDGFPVFSSLGQTYGLMNIEAAQIERIEIVKGASSVLYGTDAMGGVINVITRKPGDRAFATVSGQAGSYNSYRVSGAASAKRGNISTLVTMSHSVHDKVDRDGNQISEYIGYSRTVGSATTRWAISGKTSALLRLSAAQEARQGGGQGSILEVINDPVRRGFSETVLTKRLEVGTSIDHKFSEGFGGNLLLGYTFHDQDSDYEGEVYHGVQHIVVAQTEFTADLTNNINLIGGIPYRLEYLNENLAVDHYTYHMVGAFTQLDWHLAKDLELIAGARYDYHNHFGNVYTPRIAAKWGTTDWLTLRTGFGTGFRTPTTFYEYAHGVRPEGYELQNNAKDPETSMSGNLSATFDFGKALNATIEGAWTRVSDPISIFVTDDGGIATENVRANLDVLSVELSATTSPLSWLTMGAGYGFYDYEDEGGALTSASPSHQINFTLDTTFRKIGLNASLGLEVTAPMDLTAVYGQGYNIQADRDSIENWADEANADLNSPKLSESPWFAMLNIKIQQRIKDGVYVYAGVDNLLDFHQADKEGPLYFPAADDGSATPADVVHIWGPLRGRYIYGGLRVDL